jgi:hypothetical protein
MPCDCSLATRQTSNPASSTSSSVSSRRRPTPAGWMFPPHRHDLAYVIVRLVESYIYLDLITGEDPRTHSAEPVLRMLLR